MIRFLNKILCFLDVHKWYDGDGNGGVFCKNECYKCGKIKPTN